MPSDASRFSTPQSDACANLLRALVEVLREAAPRLNQDLPFPQRTALTGIAVGEIRRDGPDRCTAALTLQIAGGAEKDYVLAAEPVDGRTAVIVSDEADFEERVPLATAPGHPLQDRDVRAVYDALTTDLAGHFGTDS